MIYNICDFSNKKKMKLDIKQSVRIFAKHFFLIKFKKNERKIQKYIFKLFCILHSSISCLQITLLFR